MSAEEIRKSFGQEYPAAVTVLGVRMPLEKESRFIRSYFSKEHNAGAQISKFQDGTASIAFDELQREWPHWSGAERQEFCSACNWLHGNPEFPDMLRYIMRVGHHLEQSCIASSVAAALPQDEAFTLLKEALEKSPTQTANLTQGIALSKHPSAVALLREHLADLWSRPDLWEPDPFTNWTAFDATCCIQGLLELGQSASEFEEKVQSLSKHACEGNRNSCVTFLHEHYEWLPKPEAPKFGA